MTIFGHTKVVPLHRPMRRLEGTAACIQSHRQVLEAVDVRPHLSPLPRALCYWHQ